MKSVVSIALISAAIALASPVPEVRDIRLPKTLAMSLTYLLAFGF